MRPRPGPEVKGSSKEISNFVGWLSAQPADKLLAVLGGGPVTSRLEPAPLSGDAQGLQPVARFSLGDGGREVVPDGPFETKSFAATSATLAPERADSQHVALASGEPRVTGGEGKSSKPLA